MTLEQLTITATPDPVDACVAAVQRDLAVTVANLDWQRQAARRHAEARARLGLADTCEACGEPIPEARRRAVPEATLCRGCQERAERVEGKRRAPLPDVDPGTSFEFAAACKYVSRYGRTARFNGRRINGAARRAS